MVVGHSDGCPLCSHEEPEASPLWSSFSRSFSVSAAWSLAFCTLHFISYVCLWTLYATDFGFPLTAGLYSDDFHELLNNFQVITEILSVLYWFSWGHFGPFQFGFLPPSTGADLVLFILCSLSVLLHHSSGHYWCPCLSWVLWDPSMTHFYAYL